MLRSLRAALAAFTLIALGLPTASAAYSVDGDTPPAPGIRINSIGRDNAGVSLSSPTATACFVDGPAGTQAAKRGGLDGWFLGYTGLQLGTRYTLSGYCDTPDGRTPTATSESFVTISGEVSPPQNFAAQVLGPTSVKLTWDVPASGAGGPDAGPIIYYSEMTGFIGQTTTDTSLTWIGLTAGATYTTTLRAYTERNSSMSSTVPTVTFTLPPATAPVAAPRDLTATAGLTSIALSWGTISEDEGSDGGSQVTGYRILTNGANPVDVDRYTYDYTVGNLKKNTSYTFTVSAVNGVGVGSGAVVVVRTTNDTPIPPNPNGGGNGGSNNGGDPRTVTTNVPAGAPVNSDGSPDLDGNPATVQHATTVKWRTVTLRSSKPVRLGTVKAFRTTTGVPITLSIDGKSKTVKSARVAKVKGAWTVVAMLRPGAKVGAVRLLASAPADSGFEALASEHTYKVVRAAK